MPNAIRVPALRVKEVDGAPDVNGVETITVPNGTLTDDGSGAITLTTGGGSLTVKEIDGAPSVAGVSEIQVTNGTLTDNTGGSVTIAIGGGGAPTTSDYWVETTDAGLDNEVVVGTTGISTNTYAGRNAAAKAGRLFLPSDGFQIERDTGAAWAPWGPIFPLTAPVDGDFAWINQGGASVTTTKGGIYLEDPGTTGNNFRIRKKAVPGGAYTVTACIIPNILWTNNSVHCGILWRQNDGKIVSITLQYSTDWGIQVIKWNSPTSYSANYAGPLLLSPSYPLWLRMADDTANRICSFSHNGQNFIPIHSVGRTDFITATEVGFYIDSVLTTYPQGMTLLSWKEA